MYECDFAACVLFKDLLTIHRQGGYVVYGILIQVDVWLIIRPVHTLWAGNFPIRDDL